jgi:hypothetical protein
MILNNNKYTVKKMEKLRIVFMGTLEFAVIHFDSL